MKLISLRNRQSRQNVDLRLLRKIIRFILGGFTHHANYELGFHIVGATEMASVNETFLQHTGSTDVITFDYSSENEAPDAENRAKGLYGEIFICIDDAIVQAKEFGTTWQSELIRYVIHGILHLEGYDDLKPSLRKKMKAEENRRVKNVTDEFPINRLKLSRRKNP